jgi:hypothetical protein
MDVPWGVSIYYGLESTDGPKAFALPVELKEFSEDSPERPKPMLVVESAAALQSLMDELWKEGIRPSDIGTPGHLAATQAHLSDMRKLVEGTLKIKL